MKGRDGIGCQAQVDTGKALIAEGGVVDQSISPIPPGGSITLVHLSADLCRIDRAAQKACVPCRQTGIDEQLYGPLSDPLHGCFAFITELSTHVFGNEQGCPAEVLVFSEDCRTLNNDGFGPC